MYKGFSVAVISSTRIPIEAWIRVLDVIRERSLSLVSAVKAAVHGLTTESRSVYRRDAESAEARIEYRLK